MTEQEKKEHRREYSREYYLKNRDKCIAQSLQWQKRNAAKRKKYAQQYYLKNKELYTERKLRWVAEHREQYLASKRANNAKRKLRLQNETNV